MWGSPPAYTSSVLSLSLTNTTNFAFDSGGTCSSGSTTLAKGATCTVLVKSDANAAGSLAGTLSAVANNTASITLTGTASGFDPCAAVASGTAIPTILSDGTIYVGTTVNGANLCVAPSDAGANIPYDSGVANPATSTNPSSTTDGKTNTSLLAAASDAGAPYEAAQTCAALTSNGHADWYLPALNELNTVWQATQMGTAASSNLKSTFNQSGSYPAGWYWSSTARGTNGNAWLERFSDGEQTYGSYANAIQVRCARHP